MFVSSPFFLTQIFTHVFLVWTFDNYQLDLQCMNLTPLLIFLIRGNNTLLWFYRPNRTTTWYTDVNNHATHFPFLTSPDALRRCNIFNLTRKDTTEGGRILTNNAFDFFKLYNRNLANPSISNSYCS